MKQKVFYTELAYVLGLVIMAFAAAFTEKADFGMSMVVAPAYILHLKLSEFWPWFSFGVAEYVFQGVLVIIAVNGFIIGGFSKLLERFFVFKNRFQLEKYFM